MSGLLVGVSALDTIFFSARLQIRLSLVQSPRVHERHRLRVAPLVIRYIQASAHAIDTGYVVPPRRSFTDPLRNPTRHRAAVKGKVPDRSSGLHTSAFVAAPALE